MSTKLTIAELERLQAAGKIRGFKVPPAPVTPSPVGQIVTKHFSKKSPALDYIGKNVWFWSQEKGHRLYQEYRFHPDRKWRFDYAMEDLKIAVEFEGGVNVAISSHKRARRFNGDTDKYNAATAMGWMVIRLTAINYKSLLTELNKCYEYRQKA